MGVLQVRHGTLAQWLASDPILRKGEPAHVLNGGTKFGNGVDRFSVLPYVTDAVAAALLAESVTRASADALLDGRVDLLEQGGGVAVDALLITKVASAALSGHSLVVPLDDDTVGLADPSDPNTADLPVWLTVAAAVQAAPVQSLMLGPIVEPSWAWNAGSALYVGLGGTLTSVVPAAPSYRWLRKVATAINSTTIQYDPSPPIKIV